MQRDVMEYGVDLGLPEAIEYLFTIHAGREQDVVNMSVVLALAGNGRSANHALSFDPLYQVMVTVPKPLADIRDTVPSNGEISNWAGGIRWGFFMGRSRVLRLAWRCWMKAVRLQARPLASRIHGQVAAQSTLLYSPSLPHFEVETALVVEPIRLRTRFGSFNSGVGKGHSAETR